MCLYVNVCMISSLIALFNDRYNDQTKNKTTVAYTSVFLPEKIDCAYRLIILIDLIDQHLLCLI